MDETTGANEFDTEEVTGSIPTLACADEQTARTAVLPLCDHDALKASQSSWELLSFVGIQQDWDDNGNESPLALRNCSCGTTLARKATVLDEIDESIRLQQLTVSRNARTREIKPLRPARETVRVDSMTMAETVAAFRAVNGGGR